MRRWLALPALLGALFAEATSAGEFSEHTNAFEPVFRGGGGVAYIDYDGDGNEDIAVSHYTDGVLLYRNEGPDAFAFREVTVEAGLWPWGGAANGIGVADLDRDGDADLLVADGERGLRVFENRGGVFEDVTAVAVARTLWHPVAVTTADVDGDGWTDIFVGQTGSFADRRFNYCGPDLLYLNRGDGTFEEVGQARGVVNRGCTLAVAASDYDRDGDPDLISINDFGQFVVPNQLFRNDGLDASGRVWFTDVSEESGFDRRIHGMTVATADVDGNGFPDYWVTNIGRNVLLLGGPDGRFEDATDVYGIASMFSADGWRAVWGSAFMDVEADGRLDLALASGWMEAYAEARNDWVQRSLLWIGLAPDGSAADQAPELGVDADGAARGLALGDFDHDGDEDILTADLGGEVHLFRNDFEVGPMLRVRLRGTVSNPDALGALLTLRCGGTEHTREVVTGGSFESVHSPEVHLPLAGCPDGATLEIRWPSGLVEEVAVGPEGGMVSRVEPAFLTVEPGFLPADAASEATVRFVPRARDGSLRGAGLSVQMSSTSGSLSAVRDLGDGSYEATLVAPAAVEDATIGVVVDGEPLAANPRVRFFPADGDRTIVRADRFSYHSEAPDVVVTVVPKDAAGIPDGEGLDVALDVSGGEVVGAVRDLGDGRYETLLRGGGGPLVASARVAGVPRGPTVRVEEIAAVDPETTFVRMTPGAALRDDLEYLDVSIEVNVRDAEGCPVGDPNVHDYGLGGRAGPIVPSSQVINTREWVATVAASDLIAEGPVDVLVDGISLGKSLTFRVGETERDVVSRADPERTLTATEGEVAYADGEDFIWVIVRLQDDEGHALHWLDGLALESEGFETVEGRTLWDGTEHVARMRAVGPPGDYTVRVTFDGEPLGISIPAGLVPPVSHDPGALGVRTCLGAPAGVANGVRPLEVHVRPHDSHGYLVGSNVPVSLSAEGEALDLDYARRGIYVATLPPRDEPGTLRLHTSLDGTDRTSVLVAEWVAPEDAPDPSDEAPCVEIASEGDAGPSDAGDGDGSSTADSGADAGGDAGAEPDALSARGSGCACSLSTGGRRAEAWLLAIYAVCGLGGLRRRRGTPCAGR